MQHTDYTPRQDMGAVCDYDMYDRIWQRVSPELNPYPDVRGESSEVTLPETEIQFPSPPAEEIMPPVQEEMMPETAKQPGCIGTSTSGAQQSLKGFMVEELAESPCCAAINRQGNKKKNSHFRDCL